MSRSRVPSKPSFGAITTTKMSGSYCQLPLDSNIEDLRKQCVCASATGTERCEGRLAFARSKDNYYKSLVDTVRLPQGAIGYDERYVKAQRLAELSICSKCRRSGRVGQVRDHFLRESPRLGAGAIMDEGSMQMPTDSADWPQNPPLPTREKHLESNTHRFNPTAATLSCTNTAGPSTTEQPRRVPTPPKDVSKPGQQAWWIRLSKPRR